MTRRSRLILTTAIGLLAGWILAACATPQHTIAGTCAVYARTLAGLSAKLRAGELNESEEARVDELNAITRPICAAEDPPEGSVELVQTIITELETILLKRAADKEA